MKDVFLLKRRVVFCSIAILLVMLSGCIPGTTTNTAPIDAPVGDLPSVTSPVANFNDIELPADMKNDAKKACQYQQIPSGVEYSTIQAGWKSIH